MGTVFKARQPLLDRLVALKVMSPKLSDDPDFVARFIREAASAAKLHHDNMVLVHSAGEQNDIYYIVMEYVDGHSLHEHIQRKGRLDPVEALAITVYVAQALQYAWNKAHLIHRDIKPANVFLSNAGEVKVGDLGLAKSVGSETTGMTQTGIVFGSPHYISPEQARGVKDIDFRTDIYSLGCTLFHMLTGQPPYDGTDTMSIMMKHVSDPPPAIFKVLPTCPVPLGRLVGKMLAKNPRERQQSYEELIADVLAVHDKFSASASQPATASVPPTQPMATATATKAQHKTSPAAICAIAGAVGVVLLAGLLVWTPWKSKKAGPAMPAEPPASATVPSLGKEKEEVKGTLPASASPVASAVPSVKKSEIPLVDDAFVREVATLPPEEHEGGKVSALRFPAMAVSDISPIRALTDLRSLFCCGNKEQHALADLSPLRGLPLTDLNCSFTAVTDLSPLQGMPLKKLVCFSTPVQDLTPLQSSPLEEFHCSGSQVGDLTPIKNLPLRMLLCEATKVTDATPLRGMPLRELRWTFNPERDTEAILAIKTLEKINGVPVAEFWKKVDPTLVAKAKAAAFPGASTMPALSPAATATAQTGQPFVSMIGMELLYIPPGEFMLGSTKEEQAWAVANKLSEGFVKREGEQPRRTIIRQGFWMGRTEVTVGQWKQFIATTGYRTDAEKKAMWIVRLSMEW
ncbi:MAG: protein kinase [Verrucomicrobia bacterium]|nr:protein kinase [Verrucomicrobiota bacterium]